SMREASRCRRRDGDSTPRIGAIAVPLIQVTNAIAIDEAEIIERFVRASGPGGQNVNKVSSAVELRFDVRASSLPPDIKERLGARAAARGQEAPKRYQGCETAWSVGGVVHQTRSSLASRRMPYWVIRRSSVMNHFR